jgi:hypothetical protein
MSTFRAAVTGHRPGHLREHRIDPALAGGRMVDAALAAAGRRGLPLEIRAGGALGIDRAVADAALGWRAQGAPVRLVVALPFPPEIMGAKWPPAEQARLVAEIAAADELIGPLSADYAVWAYAERNRALLAGADVLLACWTGDITGGTADAIRAALIERGIPARNEQTGFARISPVEIVRGGRLRKLPTNARFVFGSNTAGRHGAGAAKDAVTYFGAVERIGEGEVGQSYALPTVDYDGRGDFSTTARPVNSTAFTHALGTLVEWAIDHPTTDYIMTDVGTGLAGLAPELIAESWRALGDLPPNLVLTPAQRRLMRG